MTLSGQAKRHRFSPTKLILIVVVCVAISGLVFLNQREGAVPRPEAEEVIDIKSTTTKAEASDPEAQYTLGRVYAKGQGVKQDYAAAAQWYLRAAQQNHAGAQAALGELCEAGHGVEGNEADAARWYRQAAELGHPGAQYSLAVLYVMGRGVPRDVAQAVQWYRRAAEQGNGPAQFNLGLRHSDGDGVARDPVEAYKWLSLAAAQGMPDAIQACKELKGRMTRQQLAESQQRIEAFQPGTR